MTTSDESGERDVRLSDLTPDPNNARKHGARNLELITDAVEEVGFARSIVIDEDRTVLAGNGLVSAASKARGDVRVRIIPADGDEIIAVQRINLTPEQKARLALYDNRSAEEATWDTKLLASLDADITRGIWTEDEFNALLGAMKAPVVEDDIDVEEEAAKIVNPVTQHGDVWTLGRHRVMCGDGTSAEDVDRLLAGQTVNMVYTDPPYGISVVGANGKIGGGGAFGGKKNEMRGAKRIESSVFAPVIGDESTHTAVAAYQLCAARAIPVMIFWGGNHYASELPSSSCWLVWDKENTGNFADAELAWTNMASPVRVFRHMWNGMVKASERGERRLHPTQKPIALAVWCFEKYGSDGDHVLDLFGGSGSTLIAAEQMRRRCFVMEMAAAYCDVIVARWEHLTGLSATREHAK